MLHVSENAAAALANARAAEGIPESYGVRLSGKQEPDGDIMIDLTFVDAPEQADEVTEQSGTDVYVSAEIAPALSTAVMDVRAVDDGLRLVFRARKEGE